MKRSRYAPGEFCWVDLASHGFDAAADFYAAVFDWQREIFDTQGGPPYARFLHQGRVVAGLGELNQEMRDAGVPAMWNAYVAVADADAAVARVARLGGQVVVPVMPVLDAGRLAFVNDPVGGAMLGLWEAGSFTGAQWVDASGANCWRELATRDVAGARRFYGELLGWDFVAHPHAPPDYSVLEVDAAEGGRRQLGGILGMGPEWGEVPAHWSVYFQVDDLEDSVARVQAAGGSIRVEPFDTPVGPLAIVADLHGAGFHLIQPHHSAA